MFHRFLLAAPLLSVAVIVFVLGTNILQPTPPPQPVRVSQSFFYKPPLDQTTPADIAQRSNLVILTRGDESFRDALRQQGYDGTLLQYVLAAEVEGPQTASFAQSPCDAEYRPWRNQVTHAVGDFCTYVHPNEDWFLHNGKGQRLYGTQDGGRRFFYLMNPASDGWRQFLIERVVSGLSEANTSVRGYDGIFLDNIELGLTRAKSQLANSDGVVQEFNSNGDYQTAWVALLWHLSEALHPERQMWGNLISAPDDKIWQTYMDHLDGAMSESFATSWRSDTYTPAGWVSSLTEAERLLARNKGFIAAARGDSDALQPFALASYLLISDGHNAHFRYSLRGDYSHWQQYDNYGINLGLPNGPRRQQADGTWRRDFEHGYVVADPINRTGQIVVTNR